MSIHYTMAMAKRDFGIGYLTRWRIERVPMQDAWIVRLGEGNGEGVLCDARTKKPRVFTTLDGAVNAVMAVGFEVNALFQG